MAVIMNEGKLGHLEKASVLAASDDPKDQDKAREIKTRFDYESLKKQIGSKKKPSRPAVKEAAGVPLTPQELEIQKKVSRLNVRLAKKRSQALQQAKTKDTEDSPTQPKDEVKEGVTATYKGEKYKLLPHKVKKKLSGKGGFDGDYRTEFGKVKDYVTDKLGKTNTKRDGVKVPKGHQDEVKEGSLHKWFKGSKSKDGKPGWVNVKTGGTCASDEPGEGTPKCVSSSKRASMTKAERDSASRRKKAADPGQQSKSGAAKPTYVRTDAKKKMNEDKILKKVAKELTKASKMHKGQADKLKKHAKTMTKEEAMDVKLETKKNCGCGQDPCITYGKKKLTQAQKVDEACWKGYEKKGMKTMFGKRYPNCVKKKATRKEEVQVEAKVDQGRSDYGKASIRNYRRMGPGHGEPAMFDPENKRGKLIDKRREEHKARRGVKGAKVPVYKTEELQIDERLGGKGYKPRIDYAGRKVSGDWEDSDRGAGNKAKKRAGGKVEKKSPTYQAYVLNKEEVEDLKEYSPNVTYQAKGGRKSGKLGKSSVYSLKDKGESKKEFRKSQIKDIKGGYLKTEDYETTKRGEVLSAFKRDPKVRKRFEKAAKKEGGPGSVKNRAADSMLQTAKDIAKRKGDTSKSDDRYAYEEVVLETKDKKGKGSGTKDACYHKVKSRYSVWPSAYASGALVKCRKKGAANWGNSSKKEEFEYQTWKTDAILEKVAAWQRKEGKRESGGLNQKGVDSYRRENPGSKLKTAVTTKPSKLKKGSKAANRRKSFCARMGGMKKRLTSAKTARDPDSRINKALRKWNCSYEPQGTPIMEQDRALDFVRKSIEKKHGKGAIYDPKKDRPPTEAQKKKVAVERKKRQDADNKAYAARAKKAGFKSTQDYTNVVARYGSEDNYRKGKGLGT